MFGYWAVNGSIHHNLRINFGIHHTVLHNLFVHHDLLVNSTTALQKLRAVMFSSQLLRVISSEISGIFFSIPLPLTTCGMSFIFARCGRVSIKATALRFQVPLATSPGPQSTGAPFLSFTDDLIAYMNSRLARQGSQDKCSDEFSTFTFVRFGRSFVQMPRLHNPDNLQCDRESRCQQTTRRIFSAQSLEFLHLVPLFVNCNSRATISPECHTSHPSS